MSEKEKIESLEKTLQKEKATKYNHKLEADVLEWIVQQLPTTTFPDGNGSPREGKLHAALKSGVVLCE